MRAYCAYVTLKLNIMNLLVKSANGQYIPKVFAERYDVPSNFENYETVKPFLNALKTLEVGCEDYWETWICLMDNAKLTGGKQIVYLDDVWAMTDKELENIYASWN